MCVWGGGGSWSGGCNVSEEGGKQAGWSGGCNVCVGGGGQLEWGV